ncbi:hypothetical protein K9D97_002602 [Enterococcus faecalis]|nr:hypothetical protein [Enterococcus faecalis]
MNEITFVPVEERMTFLENTFLDSSKKNEQNELFMIAKQIHTILRNSNGNFIETINENQDLTIEQKEYIFDIFSNDLSYIFPQGERVNRTRKRLEDNKLTTKEYIAILISLASLLTSILK